MASQKHLRAVNRSVRASGLDKDDAAAAIVELARDFARQLDAKGINGVSARDLSGYRSVIRMLAQYRNDNRPQIGPEAAQEEPEAPSAAVSALDVFRARKSSQIVPDGA